MKRISESQHSFSRLRYKKKRKLIDDSIILIEAKSRQKYVRCCQDNSSSDVENSLNISRSSGSNASYCDSEENGDDTLLFCDREEAQEGGEGRSSAMKEGDTDFTRFMLSNQVDQVLPPVIWKSLENRDYDILMKRFDGEFSKPDVSSLHTPSYAGGNSIIFGNDHHMSSKSATAFVEEQGTNLSRISPVIDNDDVSTMSRDSKETLIKQNQGTCKESVLCELLIPDKFYIALDCEMVGVGVNGVHSALARCSIVDYNGTVIYDRYIKPTEPITDYRSRWSGIFPHHMRMADPVDVALPEIHRQIENRIVIGHAVFNDFKVLQTQPDFPRVRDTAQCKHLISMAGLQGQGNSLKKLALALLDKNIQARKNGHDSVEDAIAALELFKLVRSTWESELFTKWRRKGVCAAKLFQRMQEQEKGVLEEEDYLGDKYWPSHVSA